MEVIMVIKLWLLKWVCVCVSVVVGRRAYQQHADTEGFWQRAVGGQSVHTEDRQGVQPGQEGSCITSRLLWSGEPWCFDHTKSYKRKELYLLKPCLCVLQTGLSGNIMILSVLYKGGLLMASQHLSVGELSSFLMYTFWVGISIAGKRYTPTFTSCPSLSYLDCLHHCDKAVFISWYFAGLSSFYSELMKGFGAGTRLWELLDRKPEFPLNG